MTDEVVYLEPLDGGVLLVKINNPPVNAVNTVVMEQLVSAFDRVRLADASVALLVAAGEGPFCAGADLKERLSEPAHHSRARLWRSVIGAMRQSPIPIIAAVDGACLGSGMGLLTCCDLRIASERSIFGMPEIDVGRAGGAAHLRRFIPEGIVRRMILTGERIAADEALRIHLIEEVVPTAEWKERHIRFARSIAAKGDSIVRIIKRSLDESELLGFEEGYSIEQKYTAQLRDEGFAHFRN